MNSEGPRSYSTYSPVRDPADDAAVDPLGGACRVEDHAGDADERSGHDGLALEHDDVAPRHLAVVDRDAVRVVDLLPRHVGAGVMRHGEEVVGLLGLLAYAIA
jgi:hypothetical protein